MTKGFSSLGKSRRSLLRLSIGALPVALAIACAAPSAAVPAQPGATHPSATQPGTTTPSQPGQTPQAQPGITNGVPVVANPTPAQDEAGVAPASDYAAPTRPVPKRTYVAPFHPEKLHAPAPMPTVAPIAPPPDMIRLGDMSAPRPDWLPQDTANQINSTGAGWESQISTVARSVGVAPSRADTVASAAVAGAIGGVASLAVYVGGLCVISSGLGCLGAIVFSPVIALVGTGSALAGGLVGAGTGGLRNAP